MDKLITFFRTYPVFLGFALFALIVAGLGWFFALALLRAGQSLRPLAFIGVFFAIIVGPQLFYHIQHARGLAPSLTWTPDDRKSTATDDAAVLANADGKFVHPEKVFGPGFDPQLVNDVRQLFAGLQPEVAQMVVFPNVETAVVARFPDETNARQARENYGAMMGIGRPRSAADGSFTAARAGDRVRLFVAGRTLFVWSGANDAALDRRQEASSQAWRAVAAAPRDPKEIQAWKQMAVTVPLLVLIATFWFFKGSTWASTVPPAAENALPASASELRSRLLGVENLKQPITVTAGATSDELIVTRRADAAWLTRARASGLRRTHKLVLQLDESRHRARVREYSSALDWSGGPGGAAVGWEMKTGIVFFHYQHERVFGLQLDPATGRLKPQLSYAYTFSLQELKAPFIAAVNQAGWTWKPVLWKGPSWLRWAIE